MNCRHSVLAVVVLVLILLGVCLGQALPPEQVQALEDLQSALKLFTSEGWMADVSMACTQWEGILCSTGSVVQINPPCYKIMDVGVPRYIPASITAFPGLQILCLDSCGLTQTIPDVFNSLPLLVNISITAGELGRNSDLNGTLPKSIGSLTNLNTLVIKDHPKLSGRIPASYVNLTKLITLNLSQNNLSRHIPRTFGEDMSSLANFDVSHNMLDGAIPEGLCNGRTIGNLQLTDNFFTTLPISCNAGTCNVSYNYLDRCQPSPCCSVAPGYINRTYTPPGGSPFGSSTGDPGFDSMGASTTTSSAASVSSSSATTTMLTLSSTSVTQTTSSTASISSSTLSSSSSSATKPACPDYECACSSDLSGFSTSGPSPSCLQGIWEFSESVTHFGRATLGGGDLIYIAGDFIQTSQASLEIYTNLTINYAAIQSTGSVSLSGSVNMVLTQEPSSSNNTVTLVKAAAINGSFRSVTVERKKSGCSRLTPTPKYLGIVALIDIYSDLAKCKSKDNTNIIIGIAVGVGGFVLVVIIVSIIVVVQLQRRGKLVWLYHAKVDSATDVRDAL